jgi:hypothetical protein
LVEVVVALGVLATIVSLLAHGIVGGLSVVTFARQRDVATTLANQSLEQVRALSFTDIVMGNTDLAAGGDSLITSTGAGATLAYQFRGRTIPRAAVASRAPLIPHRSTVTPDPTGTTYTAAVYVTADPSGDPQSVMVTSRVTWDHPSRKGVDAVVEIQTVLREYRCTAQSGARPCEPYWFGAGDVTQGVMRLSGSIYGQTGLEESVFMGSASSHATTEQYSVVDSTGIAPGSSGQSSGVAPTEAGSASVTATADDSITTSSIDTYEGPANVGPSGQTTSVVSSSAGPEMATITARNAAGSLAGAAAAAMATGQLPPMGTPALENDNLAQGRAASQPSGTSVMDVTLTHAGVSLGTFSLFSVGAGSQPITATSDRDPGASTSSINDDVITATADHRIGAVDLLAVPAGAAPVLPAWQGYLLRLGSFTATASATAGPGAVAASTPNPTSAGTVQYWNGTSYTSINLNSDTATIATLPTFSATFGLCSVSVGGTFTAGGRSKVVTAGTTGIQEATSTVGSPIVGSFDYTVTCAGNVLMDLDIALDLGSAS